MHSKYGRFETRASRATKQVELDMPVMPGRAQDVIFSVNESSIGFFTNIRYAVRPRTGPGHDKPTGRHEWNRLGTPYKDEVGPEWPGCYLAMNTAARAFVPNPRSRSGSFSEVVLPSLPRPATTPPFPANRRANGFRRIRKGSFADVNYEKQLPNNSRNASDPWFVKGRKGKVLAPFAFERHETPRHFDDPIFVRQRRLVDRAVNIPIFVHERFTSGGNCEAYYRSTWGSTLKPVSSPTRRPELTAHYEEVSTSAAPRTSSLRWLHVAPPRLPTRHHCPAHHRCGSSSSSSPFDHDHAGCRSCSHPHAGLHSSSAASSLRLDRCNVGAG